MKILKKNNHTEKIRKKAELHKLSFEDVLEEYKDSVRITIFAFGIDSLTGVERFFRSPDYRYEDIVEGEYNSSRTWVKGYKNYVDHILSIRNYETVEDDKINGEEKREKKFFNCKKCKNDRVVEEMEKNTKTLVPVTFNLIMRM